MPFLNQECTLVHTGCSIGTEAHKKLVTLCRELNCTENINIAFPTNFPKSEFEKIGIISPLKKYSIFTEPVLSTYNVSKYHYHLCIISF